jgi:tRNA nucleotidyltransferase (CCA-adding enzyme)
VRADGLEMDLAATRSETYPRPGALPEVRPASLIDDLARRDFTVNAMAATLTGDAELIDPHGGLDDLGRAALRVLHPRSFVDDPTRALRAARYASRYGFSLERETARLLAAVDLSTVSADRVEAELRKLAAESEARRGFELLGEWGLLELDSGAGDLIDAVSAVLSEEPWAGVAVREEAVLAAALGRGLEAARELAGQTPSRPSEGTELARGRRGVELALARGMGAHWLDAYVSQWRLVRLEIDGDDLLAEGIPEGPSVGRGLAAALRAKLDGEISGRGEEVHAAVAAARENSLGER